MSLSLCKSTCTRGHLRKRPITDLWLQDRYLNTEPRNKKESTFISALFQARLCCTTMQLAHSVHQSILHLAVEYRVVRRSRQSHFSSSLYYGDKKTRAPEPNK